MNHLPGDGSDRLSAEPEEERASRSAQQSSGSTAQYSTRQYSTARVAIQECAPELGQLGNALRLQPCHEFLSRGNLLHICRMGFHRQKHTTSTCPAPYSTAHHTVHDTIQYTTPCWNALSTPSHVRHNAVHQSMLWHTHVTSHKSSWLVPNHTIITINWYRVTARESPPPKGLSRHYPASMTNL